MFLANCPSGSAVPRTLTTTWQPGTVSSAPTHTISTFKPRCPTAIRGVAGQTFVVQCVSGATTPVATAFQPCCPTGAKTP